jgi:tetratricopeptide (TPR) repeat protein
MTARWPLRALLLALLAALLSWAPPVAGAQDGRARRAAEKVRMGAALVRAGNPGSAVAYYREAIRIDPRHEPAYVGLGELYRAQGRDSDALEAVRAGLRRRPRSIPLALLLATEAATILRRAARAEPGSVPVQRALGELARERGAFAESLAAYRAVLRLTEGDPRRAEAHAEARRFVAALRLLVREVDPPSRCEQSEVRRALCEGRD